MPRQLARHLGWVLSALALVAAACSDGAPVEPTVPPTSTADPTDSSAPEATPDREAQFAKAIADLTTPDLAALILPQRQLETFSDTLFLDARSGPISNAEAADRFPSTALTARNLQDLGRSGGYLLAFDSPSFGAYTGGPASIEVGLELFADDSGAAQYIQARWEELSLSDATLGIEIHSSEEFQVNTHGDASGRAVTATFHAYPSEVGVTTAFLRHDRLVAWIALTELNPFERSSYVTRTLEVFEQRLERVFLGELEPEVEHEIPDELAGPAVPPPINGPPFPTMTLAPRDLPSHYAVFADGYVADPGTLINYRRRIVDNGLAKLTSWAPDGIDASVMSFLDAPQITAHLDHWRTADLPDRVVEFGVQTGLKNPAVSVHQLSDVHPTLIVVGAGDHQLFGRLTIAYIWIQSDNLLSEVFAIGPAERLSTDDVLELADQAASRFAAGLASG